MTKENKPVKYPENLLLRERVKGNSINLSRLAKEIGYSREVLSNTLNGHYKGVNVVEKVKGYLENHNM